MNTSASDLLEICSFCAEIDGRAKHNFFAAFGISASPRDYILASTQNFVVMPCAGALTDWYVLIVPRSHVLSTGFLDADERQELRGVRKAVTDWLVRVSGSCEVIFFEHGSYSFRDKGGACYDHAHVHAVATRRSAESFIEYVANTVTLRPVADWIDAAAYWVSENRRSYLSVSSSSDNWIGNSEGAPGQFFRRALHEWLDGAAGEWDFALFPQEDRAREMIRAAQRMPILLD